MLILMYVAHLRKVSLGLEVVGLFVKVKPSMWGDLMIFAGDVLAECFRFYKQHWCCGFPAAK